MGPSPLIPDLGMVSWPVPARTLYAQTRAPYDSVPNPPVERWIISRVRAAPATNRSLCELLRDRVPGWPDRLQFGPGR